MSVYKGLRGQYHNKSSNSPFELVSMRDCLLGQLVFLLTGGTRFLNESMMAELLASW